MVSQLFHLNCADNNPEVLFIIPAQQALSNKHGIYAENCTVKSNPTHINYREMKHERRETMVTQVQTQYEVRPYKFTVDQYHKMGEVNILHEDSRVELIEGEILKMAAIGRKHIGLVNYLTQKFSQFPEQVLAHIQNPIQLGDYNEPEPDVILLKPREDYYQNKMPDHTDAYLVIEVADSSYPFDRKVKLPLYARFEIPDVWIVDVEKQCVEIHRSPVEGSYQESKICKGNDTVASLMFPEIKLIVQDIFKYR